MRLRIITSIAILFSWLNITAQGIVSDNGTLTVSGNQIQNGNGQSFSVAGMSMFWSSFENFGGRFYTKEAVNHVAQNWGSQIVRAAIGVEEADGSNIDNFNANFPGGLVPNPSGSGLYNNYEKELAKAKVIIDAAIANDIYVIVDFHSHYAHHFQDLAIKFFTEIATTYGDNDNIIYEIFNEPINSNDYRIKGDPNTFTNSDKTATWNNIVKPYAIPVIKAIRAIDKDNLIIVGTPGFSQGVEAAAANPILASDLNLSGADLNVAYTLHFYAAQDDHDSLIGDAERAMNQGIALFVTEWGTVEASGDGEVDEAQTKIWMNFLKDNNISHANWSITDKPEGASSIQALKGIDGLLSDELSESGSFIKCIIENWQSDAFDDCSPTDVEVVDSEDIPNGQGTKVEVESGLVTSPNDELGVDYLGDSENITKGEYDGEGIVTGLGSITGQWIAATFDGSAQGSYTLQFVVSSDSDGHSIVLQRQFGEEDLTGLIDIPNTGGLNNYEIVTVSGIPFSSTVYTNGTAQDISISIRGGGSGSFNMESFYMILDDEFDGSITDDDDDVVDDGVLIPEGKGAKIEAEKDNENTTYYGNSNEWSIDIETEESGGEGVLTGLGTEEGQSIYMGLGNFAGIGTYTVQFVVSSESGSTGNGIQIQREEGTINVGDLVTVPDTGGLNNYEIVTVSGIPIETDEDLNISVSFFGGTGSFNLESFYMTLDDDITDDDDDDDDDDDTPVVTSGIVSDNGTLTVNGSQITNEAGSPFSVAGMSMFWSSFENFGGRFYTKEAVNHVAQNWGSQIVRAAIGVEEADGSNIDNFNTNFPGGLVPNPSGSGLYNNYEKELAKAKVIIDAAIANDIYVIVDFHSHYAHHFQDLAIKFFTEIATTYGDNDNIIYEIFNEPINSNDFRIKEDPNTFTDSDKTATWNNVVKPYAIPVIKAIRAIDKDNLIIVGTPGFSQGVEAAAANPILASDLNLSGADLNVAYTLHFYAAQTEHDALISDAESAMNQGIALFVTEWGTVEASGDGEVDEAQTKIWMNFLKDNNISHANWSITDKPEGASSIQALKGIDGLLSDELSESGSFIKCIIENWQSDAFDDCSPTDVEVVDSGKIPNGQGTKVEVESGLVISPNDELGVDYLGDSENITKGEYDGEGIVTGLGSITGQWIAATFDGSAQGSYTLQFVVSSDSDGHGIVLQRQFGEEDLTGLIDIPNTGGLNNYQIVTIPGIPFSSTVYTNGTAQDISISIRGGGSGSFNMESFYIILDDEFDENVLSVPTFNPELANLISVYPNPVVNSISIDTEYDVEYRVFGLTGAEIVGRKVYNNNVDVSSLTNGIYFIQLYIDGQTQVYKFIKE